MAAVYAEVKKRLVRLLSFNTKKSYKWNCIEIKKDYQVALQNAYRRVEREQAISYILDGVNKSIGPAQVFF